MHANPVALFRAPVRRLLLAGALSVAVPVLAPAPVLAQAASSGAIEEIIVTSRRREESLQDVPIAVTAYSGEFLEEIGALDITALTQSTPNTTLEVSRATNTTLTAYIRGVGQQDPVAGFEGGVGIYLDDVYLARPQATVFDVYDVERIEVLRGPQGTLYGRNTIGGAVRYVTRRLAEDAQLEIKASVGSYSQADLLLTGSTPLNDSFRIGGTIATFNRDGYGDNLFTGEDNADKQILAFRGSAEWQATEDFFLRFYGDYSEDDSNARHGHRFLASAVTGDPVLDDVFDTRAGISTIPSSNGGLTQQVTQGGVGLLAEWGLSDQWLVKSITSYREDDSDSLIDFDNTAANTFDAPVVYKNRQFSQEFQANFSGDRLSGVLGLYYLDANAFDAFDVIIFGAATAFTLGDYDTNAWAAFADFSYDITDTFDVSVGGRFTSDERDATVTRESFLGLGSPFFGNTGAVSITTPVPGFVPTFSGNRTDEDFTPRVSLGWAPVDEHKLYVSYSEGFKGGGFDPRGAYQNPAVRAGFEPEEVESWEIGAKSVWLNGKLITNIAVFTSDYTNVQVPGSVILTDANGNPNGFAGSTTNAGKAEIDGFEIEAIGQFTDAFSTKLSLGYIDAEYTEWLVGATDPVTLLPIFVDISDQRVFQNTPKRNGNLTLRYEWPLSLFGNQGSLALIGSASYKDDSFQFEIPQPLVDQPSYTLVDASIVWSAEDNRYQLALHGRNLTDEEYVVANYNFPTVDGSVIGFYGNPLTVSLTGTVRF